MKGAEGRRAPLSRLLDRFSLGSIKQRQQQEIDRQHSRELEASRAKARIRHKPRVIPSKRGVTKQPMAKAVAIRRAANKRARLARRVNRAS